MTSVIVPPVDLAPGMPSRVVTISATDVTEGGQSLAGQMVRFALSDTLDVTSGGDVIAKTQAEVVLDANGEGRIRLPVYTDAVKTWCGDPDWAILVTATWGSQKAIRVPAGSTSIALSSLPPVRPLRGREKQWAITGVSVNASIGDPSTSSGSYSGGILGLDIKIPAGIWSKPAPAGANFNEYYTDAHSGHWYFSAVGAAGMSGLPAGFTDKAGSILVLGASSRVASQFYLPYGYFSTDVLVRSNTNTGTNVWSPWKVLGEQAQAAPFTRGSIPLNTNVNDWYLPDRNGLWQMSVAISGSLTGLPDGMAGRNAQFLVLSSASSVSTQMYIPYGYYGDPILTRSVTNVTTKEWSDWAPMGGSSAGAGSGLSVQHSIRQTQLIQAMGGPIDTGGKAAVALRFDHGLLNFRDKVLPLTKARGMKVSQAYNPRRWHLAENQGITATDLNSWVAAGDVEIWNHSATHIGAESEDALYTEIVTGLEEIEAELPAARGKVWGFNPPGVSSGDWMGFNNGGTPAQWDTYAGRLILQHHAVASGYLPGTQIRPLDGTIRDGQSHYTMDGLTVATIKGHIDSAIAQRGGLQLMLHPSQLDTAGNLTSAQFTEVLDYIVAKRTAGDLVTLSPYQMMVADSTRPPVTIPDVVGLVARLAALEYRSGLRDISALATTGWSDVQATTWRVGQGVNIAVNRLGRTTASTGTETVLTLPSGYRPPDTMVVRSGRGMVARILTSGAVQVIAPGVSVDYFAISFDTLQAPATTEPGSPV